MALFTCFVLVTGCDVTSGAEPAPVEPTATIASIDLSTDIATTQPPDVGGETPLISDGCAAFDAQHLGVLTRMPVPLTLVTEDVLPSRLSCVFAGVAEGRDASAMISIQPLTARSDGYFRTAGEFETELDVNGAPGVGTGRGSLRAQLDDALGLTLTVGLRALVDEVIPYTDREHLEIRDAVADYVVSQLVP